MLPDFSFFLFWTTGAPHSEMKMKEEGKGDSNQTKLRNEVNRHIMEKHREGLAAQK